MKLSLEGNYHANQIHAYDDNHVVVRDRQGILLEPLTNNFILTPDQVISNWQVSDISQLTHSDLDDIQALEPEVILFSSLRPLTHSLYTQTLTLIQNGIGVEFMTLGAACRTYNLLVNEQRRVVLAVCL